MLPQQGYMVYVLIDPRNRVPFYVGATCRPHQRLIGHSNDWSNSVGHRLRELCRLGLKCRVRLVRTDCSLKEARTLEAATIAALSATLLNRSLRRAGRRAAPQDAA